jgi:Cdc6-like AAA superfamily ATPase
VLELVANNRNPYNFSNPVRKQELFSGRERELRDIRYYLNDARFAEQPVSLAILGARASGKSSLLYMLEHEAHNLDFVVARVKLNESDVATPFSFFYKVLHSLILTAFDTPLASDASGYAFGGRDGKVAITYDRLITTGELPDDLLFSPFAFPLFYARKLVSSGQAPVFPEELIAQDLRLISQTVQHPVALLFDEGDVLTTNRILLQMMRNIFQDIERFVVVLVGTPMLFDTFDDVFSPIVRQFKKIDVGPFPTDEEIRSCIRRPLQTITGLNPDEVVNTSSVDFIREVRAITGGSAYEIQLVCHFMYRALQSGTAPTMRLTNDVIDSVRRELGTGHTLASRPLLGTIQQYDATALNRLRALLRGELYQTLVEVRYCMAVAMDDVPSLAELEQMVNAFVDDGVLARRGDRLVFAGDELDRLYLRYCGTAHRVFFPRAGAPHRVIAVSTLEGIISGYGPLHSIYSSIPIGQNEVGQFDKLSVVRQIIASADDFKYQLYRPDQIGWAFLSVANALRQGEGALLLGRVLVEGAPYPDIYADFVTRSAPEAEAVIEQMVQSVRSKMGRVGCMVSLQTEETRSVSVRELSETIAGSFPSHVVSEVADLAVSSVLAIHGSARRDMPFATELAKASAVLGFAEGAVNAAYLLRMA